MRRLAGVLVALTLGLAAAPEARAFSDCTYDGAGTVTATRGDGPTGPSQFTVTGPDSMNFDGSPCFGATTANTTAVNVNAGGEALELNFNVPAPSTVFTITNMFRLRIADSGGGAAKWRAGALADGRRVVDLDDDGLTDVVGGAQLLTLDGLGGNDALSGAGGFAGPGGELAGPGPGTATNLWGGDGDDTLTGPARMAADAGNDTVVAGPTGTTGLDYSDTPEGVRMKSDLSGTETSGDGHGFTDTFVGFAAATTVLSVDGSPNDDVIYGGAGDDVLLGGPGDDLVRGGGGADRIYGGSGVDTLEGGAGNDTLGGDFSDAGDVLRGGPGSDTFEGGAAGEIFDASDDEADTVRCAGGADSGRADRVDTLTSCEFGPPVVSVAPAAISVAEGAPAQLTLTLGYAIDFPAAVDVSTADGTASAGSDYTKVTKRVTFPAGTTSVPVDVATLTDAEDEPAQTFSVGLANPSNAPALGAGSTVTIDDANTPVTTVTLEPAAGKGAGGIHLAPPTVSVSASAAEVRCVLDPATTPVAFADFPAGSCAYAGAGQKVHADGAHRLCAVSRSEASGDVSPVACATWTTDATPPAVTCAPASFKVGDRGKVVTATVGDATSGPVAVNLSAPADTATSGEKAVTFVARDKAGNATTVNCSYSVSSVVLCGQPLVLHTLQLAGRRVELAGLTALTHAGKLVTIEAGGKRVGTTTVAPDGSFSLRVKAPKASRRARIRYRATLPDGASTPALKLSRSLIITRRTGRTVHGRIVAKRSKRPGRVVFYRQDTCTSKRVFATAKVSRSGTFKVKLTGPVAPEPIALYRVTARVGKGSSYTVPIVVTGAAR